MEARDVMTCNVVSVTGDMPLRKLPDVLFKNRISGVPVGDGSIVGIVGRADLVRALAVTPRPLPVCYGTHTISDAYQGREEFPSPPACGPLAGGEGGAHAERVGG
jgi:CBS domain-containing protein